MDSPPQLTLQKIVSYINRQLQCDVMRASVEAGTKNSTTAAILGFPTMRKVHTLVFEVFESLLLISGRLFSNMCEHSMTLLNFD